MALDAVGLGANEVAFVGDSVRYDVTPSALAGMVAVHFDPLSLCHDKEHRHVSALAELLTDA